MTNEPKKCEECGKDICDSPYPQHGCSALPSLSSSGRIETVLCHGHPQVAKEAQPQEGVGEKIINESFAQHGTVVFNANVMEIVAAKINQTIRQEKAASREEGHSAALDEAIGVVEDVTMKWEKDNKDFRPLADLVAALNALKGKKVC